MCCGDDIPPIRNRLVTPNKNSQSFVLYIAKDWLHNRLSPSIILFEILGPCFSRVLNKLPPRRVIKNLNVLFTIQSATRGIRTIDARIRMQFK